MKKKPDLEGFRMATEADLVESTGEPRFERMVWHLSISGLEYYQIKSYEDVKAFMILIQRKQLWVKKIWRKNVLGQIWVAVNYEFEKNGIANGFDLVDEEGQRILLETEDYWVKTKLGYILKYNAKTYYIYDNEIPSVNVEQLSLF